MRALGSLLASFLWGLSHRHWLPQALFPRLLAGHGQLGGRLESEKEGEARLFLPTLLSPASAASPPSTAFHSSGCCSVGGSTLPGSFEGPPAPAPALY